MEQIGHEPLGNNSVQDGGVHLGYVSDESLTAIWQFVIPSWSSLLFFLSIFASHLPSLLLVGASHKFAARRSTLSSGAIMRVDLGVVGVGSVQRSGGRVRVFGRLAE